MMRAKLLALAAAVAAIGAVAMLAAAPASDAHIKYGDEWYFRGSTYTKKNEIKDPVNFIWTGNDDYTYDRDHIEDHMARDWDTDRVGGRSWRRDTLIAPFCKDDQRMFWVIPPDSQTNDLTDWHGIAGISCGSEHHARFWDDRTHAKVTDHGRLYQWAVGGIHHEKVKVSFSGLHHVIDRDWDAVRRQMVRAMHRHCADAKWRYHPGADGVYQKWTNSGFIARISLHHAEDGGCDGW